MRKPLEEIIAAGGDAARDIGLYEELGTLLKDTDPKAAVDLYASYPFSSTADFGENALRLFAVKLMLAQEAAAQHMHTDMGIQTHMNMSMSHEHTYAHWH